MVVNEKNEIIAYALIGDLQNSVSVDNSEIPQEFITDFYPRKYLYTSMDGVYLNVDFEEDDSLDSKLDEQSVNAELMNTILEQSMRLDQLEQELNAMKEAK